MWIDGNGRTKLESERRDFSRTGSDVCRLARKADTGSTKKWICMSARGFFSLEESAGAER
jgi:hypothetical protein